MQTDLPWFFEAQTPYADLVQRTLETEPELVKLLLAPERPKAHPDAKSILRWETNMVRPAYSVSCKPAVHRRITQAIGTACTAVWGLTMTQTP